MLQILCEIWIECSLKHSQKNLPKINKIEAASDSVSRSGAVSRRMTVKEFKRSVDGQVSGVEYMAGGRIARIISFSYCARIGIFLMFDTQCGQPPSVGCSKVIYAMRTNWDKI